MARNFVAASSQNLDVGTATALNLFGSNPHMSVQCWFKLASTGSERKMVGRWGDSPHWQYLLEVTNLNKISFLITDGLTHFDIATGTTSLTTGVWYHALGVKIGTGANALKVYLNGTQEASITSNDTMATETALKFMIGATNETSTNYMDGAIAEVAVWSTDLSSADATALAGGVAADAYHPSSLVGYWPLNKCLSPEPDTTANANNATVNGATCTLGPPWTQTPLAPSKTNLIYLRRNR